MIRRLAFISGLAIAGALPFAIAGQASAWGDGNICYQGKTYSFDKESDYYDFLAKHPGAKEGKCVVVTTTATPTTIKTTTTIPATTTPRTAPTTVPVRTTVPAATTIPVVTTVPGTLPVTTVPETAAPTTVAEVTVSTVSDIPTSPTVAAPVGKPGTPSTTIFTGGLPATGTSSEVVTVAMATFMVGVLCFVVARRRKRPVT